jgi:hypothetical protein
MFRLPEKNIQIYRTRISGALCAPNSISYRGLAMTGTRSCFLFTDNSPHIPYQVPHIPQLPQSLIISPPQPNIFPSQHSQCLNIPSTKKASPTSHPPNSTSSQPPDHPLSIVPYIRFVCSKLLISYSFV